MHPVSPLTTSAGPDGPLVGVHGARSAPAGFDEALRGADARTLPSVRLGEMVAALAAPPGTAPPAAGVADGAVRPASLAGDAWGVASDRPAVDAAGPGAAVLTAGERYLGVPYRWGGTDPETGFDCSGFVQQVYADLGIRLPRVSIDQSRAGRPVADLGAAQPGDLVFWHGNGSRPNHIGIYAGDGRMLVAPRTGDVVRYQEITRTPDAIRRVVG